MPAKKELRVQKCVTLIGMDGSVSYFDWDDADKLICKTEPPFEYSDVHDMRNPPFLQILPCPYCGVNEDKDHDLSLHVNPKLGTQTFTLFRCGQCGGGMVRMLPASGQTREIDLGIIMEIPRGTLIPCCEKCGEEYFSKEDAERVDSLIRKKMGQHG